MSPEDLNDLGRALRRLRPAPPPIDRDGLLFEAGRRAGRRERRWPLAVAAAVAILCGAGLAVQALQPTRERVVTVYLPPPPPPQVEEPERPQDPDTPLPAESVPQRPAEFVTAPAPVPSSPRHGLEERLLRWGFDGMGAPPPLPPSPPRSADEVVRSF